ncbi:unnamed protein product [Parnassius mnemosyne]|uniref:Reverse transcriptase Ty1/copia-type domain-containing protein n=1 Tax=Parnassius mnemosyne TaxID=213953 RepID=A0AAV1LM92_9NEOP
MDQTLITDDSDETAENPRDETNIPSEEERSDISTSSSNFEKCTSEIEDIKYPEPVSKLEKRVIQPPQRYGFSNVCVIEDENIGNECFTYENVINDTIQEEWYKAMEGELQSFRDSDAWDLVDKPSDAHVVQCKWVFKRKLNSDNTMRYRAGLVAKGCVVSHECREEQTVALSSTEAEYMAICEASKEAIFLKNLLTELIVSKNSTVNV